MNDFASFKVARMKRRKNFPLLRFGIEAPFSGPTNTLQVLSPSGRVDDDIRHGHREGCDMDRKRGGNLGPNSFLASFFASFFAERRKQAPADRSPFNAFGARIFELATPGRSRLCLRQKLLEALDIKPKRRLFDLVLCCLGALLCSAHATFASAEDSDSPLPHAVKEEGAVTSNSPWPWLSPDSRHVNILRLLRWYNTSAVGALTPPHSLTFPLSATLPQLRELGALKCVERRWIIEPSYRNALFWGESKSGESMISLFPFRFSIEELVATEPRPSPVGESLEVSFKWRVIGLNELAQKIRNSSSAPLSAAVQANEKIIGQSGFHSLSFFKGEFGYYRPITREPLTRETQCD